MKFKFLGVGSAFAKGYNSSILIEGDNHKMIYDYGRNIPEALDEYNISFDEIDAFFISHLHDDHAGGLENLGFKTYFSDSRKPKIIAREEVVNEMWDGHLKSSMKYLQGKDAILSTYFNVHSVAPEPLYTQFDFCGQNDTDSEIRYYTIKNEHCDGSTPMPCFGLWMIDEKTRETVLISGDTILSERLKQSYENTNLIFQDCEFNKYDGGVHAQYHELCELDESIKGKMWLYHYDLKGADFDTINNIVKKEGFLGLVKEGQTIEV